MREFFCRYRMVWKSALAALAVLPFLDPFSAKIAHAAPFLGDAESLSGNVVLAVWVFAAAALLLNIAVSVRYANQPLSVLRSRIDIEFLDPRGERVSTKRQHLLRAEQPGIWARYREVVATQGGKIPKEPIAEHRIPPAANDRLLRLGRPTRRLIVQKYESPLPYSWLYQLLVPDWLCCVFVELGKSPGKFFRQIVTVESSELVEVDEYLNRESELRVIASRYSHTELTITLKFHEENPPESVEAHLLRSMTIEDGECENPATGSEPLEYVFKFRDLSKQAIARVGWRLSHDFQQQDAVGSPSHQ